MGGKFALHLQGGSGSSPDEAKIGYSVKKAEQ